MNAPLTPHGLGSLHVFTRDIKDGGHGCLAEATVMDAHGRTIAGVHIRPGRTDAQHIAAAHLFAAAPDLVAALKALTHEAVWDTDGDEQDRKDFDAAFALAEAAVAKAEGRS